MKRRTRLVYGLLLAVWCIIVGWQAAEHNRVKKSAAVALKNRSRDITTALGLVIRSQRRFGGVVFSERLESALKELVKSGELSSIALLNASGEVVASSGVTGGFETSGIIQAGERWEDKRVTFVNLVDLGASDTPEGENNPRTIVLPPRRDMPPPPWDRMRGPDGASTNSAGFSTNSTDRVFAAPGGYGGSNDFRRDGFSGFPPPPTNWPSDLSSNAVAGGFPTNRPPRWRRPNWMSEAEYKSLLQTRGLHGLAIGMATENYRRACTQDLWMRLIIGCFASVSVVGLGLAWRNVDKSSELQMRLLRASELNSHLKQMNLAVAGLAHETRNPLNIIRGLAQMISKQEEAPGEVRGKSREIVDEADRVTAQLNEFINYSRPREVRRTVIALGSVIREVVRALNYDIEEKNLRLDISGDQVNVEADEQLLRQALFNLLLNATQAVEMNGEIQVFVNKETGSTASLEIRDSGPGVPASQRSEIFKPYVTTNEKGTGLGLAVVQQIILAHGWEIECVANQPKGAIFRITHLKLANRT